MSTYEPFDWYETPLYYDIIFDVDTEKEIAFITGALEQYGQTQRGRRKVRAFEPACGSGRLMVPLAQLGWSVHGFDLSAGMLAFAQQRFKDHGVKCGLSEQAMQDFQLPGFGTPDFRGYDIAFNFVSTFKYLLTEQDARAHLQCVADHLAPGGIYLLGLHETEEDQLQRMRERWVAHRDGVQVVCNIQSWPPDYRKRTERVRSRLVVTELATGDVKRYESEWTFRTYSEAQLAALVKWAGKNAGLELAGVYDFRYRLDEPMQLTHPTLDKLLVLRKAAG